MKKLRFLILLISASALAQSGTVATPSAAQTFFTIANEGDTVTFNTPSSYSFGALSGTTLAGVVCSSTSRNCFAPLVTVAAGKVLAVANGTADMVDPANGVPKILQVLQNTSVQTGSTKSASTGLTTNWTVPAVAVAVAPPSLTLTVTGATITTPIVLQLGGTLGWCTFISANTNANYGIALSGCLTPPPGK